MNLLYIKMLNTAIKRELNRGMAEYGMTYAQASVLGLLYELQSENVCQKDVEFHLGLSHPTVSSILLRLEEKGLIAAEQLPSDRRFKRLVPTRKALSLRHRIGASVSAIRTTLFCGLPDNEIEALNKVITRMLKNLNAWPDQS